MSKQTQNPIKEIWERQNNLRKRPLKHFFEFIAKLYGYGKQNSWNNKVASPFYKTLNEWVMGKNLTVPASSFWLSCKHLLVQIQG